MVQTGNYRIPPIKLKLFEFIDFTKLKSFILNDTNVDSLEPLSFMIFPFLEIIDLHDNKITSLK